MTAATTHGPGIGCTCEWDEVGNPVGGKHKPPCRMAEGSDAASTPHPATAKAWEWFEENASTMDFDRRERIFLALAEIDADLWKLDNTFRGEPLRVAP